MRARQPLLLRVKMLKSIRKASLLLAILISLLFTAALCFVKPEAALSSITAAVFGASGAIVALALPAAELAGNSITRIGEYWLGRFTRSVDGLALSSRPDKGFALSELGSIKEKALTARKGSLYVFFAFVISAFSLLTPRLSLFGYLIFTDYVLLGFASGFLLLGSGLFFPFTWSVYRLDALEDVEEAIRNFPADLESEKKKDIDASVT